MPSDPRPLCGHRAPLNYDRTRWAICCEPEGHDHEHRNRGGLVWTDRTMPCRMTDHARPPETGKYDFDPDWVISPGETLREWMEENGFVLGQRLLLEPVATACGRMDLGQLQGILDGKRRITTVAACKLQQGTDIPARLWLNLERAFRQGLAEGKTWESR